MWFPMFPLGRVLFPTQVLPLRVFEPRYLEMIERCTAGDPRFGVVLIERGSEVGGGDERFDLGTAASIVGTSELDDRTLAVITVGGPRVRVTRWLPDDPYPRAEVEFLGEPAGDGAPRALRRVLGEFARVRALASELGMESGLDTSAAEAGGDAAVISHRLAALAPVGPLDAQELLEAADAAGRLDLLAAKLDEVATLLEMRLAAD